jgi:hypothetical protein
MARFSDIALIDHADDETAPRSICVYHVEPEDIDPSSGLAESGVKFKLNPSGLLYALRWLYKAEPPVLDLALARDPKPWLLYVTTMLLGALCRDDPGLRERIAAVAASF